MNRDPMPPRFPPGPVHASLPRVCQVLGTPLLATSYDDLATLCRQRVEGPSCLALDFANTQVVAMRRHEPVFAQLTQAYDWFIPDGMPLIWCMNRQGAGLTDRVYGPTFMRHFLQGATDRSTHYLLGGSRVCGDRLRSVIQQWNSANQVVGSFHEQCQADGSFGAAQDQCVVDELNALSPDYLWVGLGTPKQDAWIHRHKPLIQRGLILAVGFAFDVNAGLKPDAPPALQRRGLTWLYRLVTEPRRLGPRYFKYNLLFLWYLLRDSPRAANFH